MKANTHWIVEYVDATGNIATEDFDWKVYAHRFARKVKGTVKEVKA